MVLVGGGDSLGDRVFVVVDIFLFSSYLIVRFVDKDFGFSLERNS